jgi:hypothetical protein
MQCAFGATNVVHQKGNTNMSTDYGKELVAEIETIQSLDDICKNWHKWKPILAAAQSILGIFFPPGAAIIGAIIAIFDKVCPVLKIQASLK